jgi:hypothetical protein
MVRLVRGGRPDPSQPEEFMNDSGRPADLFSPRGVSRVSMNYSG